VCTEMLQQVMLYNILSFVAESSLEIISIYSHIRKWKLRTQVNLLRTCIVRRKEVKQLLFVRWEHKSFKNIAKTGETQKSAL